MKQGFFGVIRIVLNKGLPAVLIALMITVVIVPGRSRATPAIPLTPAPSTLSELMAGLSDLQGEKRIKQEISIARTLARKPQAAVRHNHTVSTIAQRVLLLRLMSLAGSPEFVPPIAAALNHQSQALRQAGLKAALTLNHPNLAEAVGKSLHASEPEEIALALRYFRQQPGSLAASQLMHLLASSDSVVQGPLLDLLPHWRLAAFKRHCAQMLLHRSGPVRIRAINCIGAMAERALSAKLQDQFARETTEGKLAIVRALQRLEGRQAVPRFLGWLRQPEPRVALGALLALQALAAKQSVPELIRIIEEGASPLPDAVLIKSLGLFRSREALPYLENALRQARIPERKLLLLEALGDTGLLAAQAPLLEFLAHPDPTLRGAAKKALQNIARSQARQP